MAGILDNLRNYNQANPGLLGGLGQLASTYGRKPWMEGQRQRSILPNQLAYQEALRKRQEAQARRDELARQKFEIEQAKWEMEKNRQTTENTFLDKQYATPQQTSPMPGNNMNPDSMDRNFLSQNGITLPQTTVSPVNPIPIQQAPAQGQGGVPMPSPNIQSNVNAQPQVSEYVASLIKKIDKAENTMPVPKTIKRHNAIQNDIMGWKKEINDLMVKEQALQYTKRKDETTRLDETIQSVDGIDYYPNRPRNENGTMKRVNPGAERYVGPSAAKKMALELGLKPGSKPFENFLVNYANKDNISFSTNSEGGVTFNRGGDGLLLPRTEADLEKDIVGMGTIKSNINTIRRRFKKEFQEIPTKISMKWLALKDKLGGGESISLEDRKELTDFTSYRRDAYQMFSNILKELSGVAVNPTEYERAEQWIPNPGTGMFDGDSPMQMQAKLDGFEVFVNKAMAKAYYIRKHGIDKADLDLNEMTGIMKDYGKEYYNKIITQPGVTSERAKALTQQQVKEEFGLL